MSQRTQELGEILDLIPLVATRIRRQNLESLSRGCRCVLSLLQENGPSTVPSLARRLQTTRQNTQVIVKRLVAKGLVIVRPNPSHKRSSLVLLSEEGRKQLEPALVKGSDALERLSGTFNATEFAVTLQSLKKLLDQLPLEQRQRERLTGHLKVREEPDPAVPDSVEPTDIPVNLL